MTDSAEIKPLFVGTAHMRQDGSIDVMLRSEGAGGAVGHGSFIVPTDAPAYERFIEHVGGLKPGESAGVPVFPLDWDWGVTEADGDDDEA